MRIVVALLPEERIALCEMALKAIRDPRDHVRWLIRREAERLSLIPPFPEAVSPQQQEAV